MFSQHNHSFLELLIFKRPTPGIEGAIALLELISLEKQIDLREVQHEWI